MLAALLLLLIVTPTLILSKGEEGNAAGSILGEWTDFWVVRLTLNLLGYATLVVPGYLLIRYVKNTNYIDRASEWCIE